MITSPLRLQRWMGGTKKKKNKSNVLVAFPTRVTVDGENMILVAIKYGEGDPLPAAGLVAGLHFCNPSAFRKRVRWSVKGLTLLLP